MNTAGQCWSSAQPGLFLACFCVSRSLAYIYRSSTLPNYDLPSTSSESSMRAPKCTVARRVSKLSSTSLHFSDVRVMPQDYHPIRRCQLIQHPHISKSLGPISLLPNEVLSNIFLCCISDSSDCAGGVRNTSLILAQVCSSWRKACLRIPHLWTTLNLRLNTANTALPRLSPFALPEATSLSPSPAKRNPQALANLASLWFERARNQLLSVSVKLTSTYASPNSADVSSALQPILTNGSSVRHLSIHATFASQLRDFFTSLAAFDNLESLSLSVQHMDITAPITTFRNSPRLSRVSFDLHGYPPSTSLIHLPWNTIEEFEMTGSSMLPSDTFQSLLASCISLQKASFWVEDAFQDNGDTTNSGDSCGAAATAITTIPKLAHLSISFYGRHEKTASSLLTSFNLPHLRHFHFFSGFITLPFLPSIASDRLETLVASGIKVSAAGFRAFAAANPSLFSLTLDLRYFDSADILDVLDVLAAEKPRAFPSITNLSLWVRDISPHSSAYLRMIHSRGRNPSASLRFALYLSRQQHGACCHFSSCAMPSEGYTRLDEILALADACERAGGVDFYLKDVKPDEGIDGIV